MSFSEVMKFAVLFFAVVCIGLKTCEAAFPIFIRDMLETMSPTKKPIPTKKVIPEKNDALKRQLLAAAMKQTKALLNKLEKQAKSLPLSAIDAKLGTILSSNDRCREIGRSTWTQVNVIMAYKELLEKNPRVKYAKEDFWKFLDRVFDGKILGVRQRGSGNGGNLNICPFGTVSCDKTQKTVRQFNGQCNNLRNPLYGAANTAQNRWLPAVFSDGICVFRKSVSGADLPSARAVTHHLLQVGEVNDPQTSYLTMQIGQFLDHDLTNTPMATTRNGDVVHCGEDCVETELCKPIIPGTGKKPCMNFVRSELFLETSCTPVPIVPGNTITSWIDASQVYGNSDEKAQKLVDFITGYMKVTKNPLHFKLKPYLPYNTPEGDSECESKATERCFLAGDDRQNEQMGLTAMHTVFVRLHNYIANQLETRKPGIAGKELFHLTRKILIGFWQHIVYSEYLPSILGSDIMKAFQLFPQTNGFFKGYDASIKPDISVAFSTAAFRFGHTQIKTHMTFNNANHNSARNVFLSTIQFNPHRLYNSGVSGVSGVDAVIQGLLGVPDGARDNRFADQIRNHLFADKPPHGPGFDLPALNIQRGRDHGLPSYVYWREFLGLDANRPKTFNQLKDIRGNPNKFENVYESVEDIDLYAGGINEVKANGAQVGPTFGSIIALQFRKLKFGDRFYYERNIGSQGFTAAQLAQVKRISLARILCDTLDAITTIQPRALYLPNGSNNRRVSCDHIKDIDYSVFIYSEPTINLRLEKSSLDDFFTK